MALVSSTLLVILMNFAAECRLETERLMLRTWNDNDLQPMLAINQDPKVMEYFPGLQDLEMTKNFIDKVNAHFENHGYSLYATVRKDTNEFIGLNDPHV
jgi:RimJ/RimL family protein N-acetyltransferase